MDDRRRSPLRLLAPLALVLFGVVFLIVIFSASSGDDPDDGARAGARQLESEDRPSGEGGGPTAKNYRVEEGDTLDGIAERTDVDVDALQELNPDLDPQALVTGQKIKLRE